MDPNDPIIENINWLSKLLETSRKFISNSESSDLRRLVYDIVQRRISLARKALELQAHKNDDAKLQLLQQRITSLHQFRLELFAKGILPEKAREILDSSLTDMARDYLNYSKSLLRGVTRFDG